MPTSENVDLRDRFRGAFLGCARLGDAIGRPFEMMSATDGRLGSGLDALLTRSGRLSFSDDTEMMISVAESLVRIGGISGTDVMAALAENYDPAALATVYPGMPPGLSRNVDLRDRFEARSSAVHSETPSGAPSR